MNMPSRLSDLPLGWLAAGVLLVAVMVVSYSFGEDEPEVIPTMAIDEDLAPLQSGALEYQNQYTDLVVPVALNDDEFVGGTAP